MPDYLPQNSLILVTGANGFIASHTIDTLLTLGYRVRGTVRNPEKAQWLVELMKQRHPQGHVELVKVEDFTKAGCFDGAVKGCSGLVHAASDLSFSANPNDIIPPVLASINHAMNAAAKEPSMKSFLYTSSSTAATNPYPNKKFHISKDTWNDKTVEDAWAPPPYEDIRKWAVYGASKTQGEKRVWEWTEENKPQFKVNAIAPNANFGEILSPENQSASTAGWIRMLASGQFETVRSVPPQYFVNVKDTAKLHAAVVTDLSLDKERVFAFAEPYNWNKVLAVARRLRPDLELPADIEDNSEDLSTVDYASALQILKERYGQTGWTGLEESLRENLQAVPKQS